MKYRNVFILFLSVPIDIAPFIWWDFTFQREFSAWNLKSNVSYVVKREEQLKEQRKIFCLKILRNSLGFSKEVPRKDVKVSDLSSLMVLLYTILGTFEAWSMQIARHVCKYENARHWYQDRFPSFNLLVTFGAILVHPGAHCTELSWCIMRFGTMTDWCLMDIFYSGIRWQWQIRLAGSIQYVLVLLILCNEYISYDDGPSSCPIGPVAILCVFFLFFFSFCLFVQWMHTAEEGASCHFMCLSVWAEFNFLLSSFAPSHSLTHPPVTCLQRFNHKMWPKSELIKTLFYGQKPLHLRIKS